MTILSTRVRAVHRLLPRALACGALGVLTTFCTAWGLATFVPLNNAARRMNAISQPDRTSAGSRPTLSYITVFQFSKPGAVRLSWRPGFGSGWDQLDSDLRSQSSIDLHPASVRQPRDWGKLPSVLAGDFSKAGSGAEDARGWPFLAVWCELAATNSGTDVEGGVVVSSGTLGLVRVLPYFPIWRGILADSAIFAILWFMGVAIYVRLRGMRRLRRGHCPRCAYVLSEQSCSECGWKSRAAPSESAPVA